MLETLKMILMTCSGSRFDQPNENMTRISEKKVTHGLWQAILVPVFRSKENKWWKCSRVSVEHPHTKGSHEKAGCPISEVRALNFLHFSLLLWLSENVQTVSKYWRTAFSKEGKNTNRDGIVTLDLFMKVRQYTYYFKALLHSWRTISISQLMLLRKIWIYVPLFLRRYAGGMDCSAGPVERWAIFSVFQNPVFLQPVSCYSSKAWRNRCIRWKSSLF